MLIIEKYEDYQDSCLQSTNEQQTNQQTNNKRTTNEQQQLKNIINKEDSIYSPIGEVITSPQGDDSKVDISKPVKKNNSKTQFIPPSYNEVLVYAKERSREDMAKKFYDYFTAGNWIDGKGNKVLNWKQKFITWDTKNPIVKKTNCIC